MNPNAVIYSLSFMGGISKYFKSEWSYAQFRIQGERALCGFSEDGAHLITVTTDGQYYVAEIPQGGGQCKEIIHRNIM